MKIMWKYILAVCKIFQHLPSHGIQLVLNSVSHSVTQQNDAITEFTLMCS
jgi:hypothetical protein